VTRESAAGLSANIQAVFDEHIPDAVDDVDGDYHSTRTTLRGTSWRGRDCNDSSNVREPRKEEKKIDQALKERVQNRKSILDDRRLSSLPLLITTAMASMGKWTERDLRASLIVVFVLSKCRTNPSGENWEDVLCKGVS